MHVTVFGATRRLGRQILRAARDRGFTVTAHARRLMSDSEPGIEWATGDAGSAVKGTDAVLVVFGPRTPSDVPFLRYGNRADPLRLAAARRNPPLVRDGRHGRRLPKESNLVLSASRHLDSMAFSAVDGRPITTGDADSLQWDQLDCIQTPAAYQWEVRREDYGRTRDSGRHAVKYHAYGLGDSHD